ncbi:PKD domain-containing protein [Methanosphaerula palustris]|uniref:PKD domain containing protein n=1 Tax=Methanosphaerula palustris (strain ATCC BAA-1556 / DSM 19958 / E1-9c) TaxID=521011 RepID=B8GG29_METPE|nr:PKD domain-containing protein [Methanosphaerula palustris]ACL16103.1 PKD domain containing protein [Methanosphaerula palustris E1-9c]
MRSTYALLLLVLVLVLAAPVAAAQTTDVQVIHYAGDGTTVANQETVNVSWMESNLPVFGDGATPYLLQGPMLNITNYSDPAKWNPAEDTNIDKVDEMIKGTKLVDLCNLVGGMHPGDEVKIIASDGFTKTFPYENVYNPQARQGPMVLAWWTARQGYDYSDGIRLFFGADTSTNPWGLHVYGNQDMKNTLDEKYWAWYGGTDALPNAAQLSNKWIAKVEIVPTSSSNWTNATTVTPTPTATLNWTNTTTVTPTPTATQTSGPVVLFDGNLTLTDGTFPGYAYNSGATHQVQNLTPHGALELASKAANFTYDATDKKWSTLGTFMLDNAGGFNYDNSAAKKAWAYRVNGVWKNDFSSSEGISTYRLNDGDLVEYYYGVNGGAFKDAEAVIRIRISIREPTTIFDGSVTLMNGTFPFYAYNSGTTHNVGNLTVQGALEATAEKGGFTYIATDKKWNDLGTVLLDGVSTYNKTQNLTWAYTQNGVVMNDFSANQGISVQQVKNGDNLVFYYGVKGASLDAATAVVRIRVFVANDVNFTLTLNGAQSATFSKADFEASGNRVEYTDISGTWSGIPLWRLVGLVDDGDPATFNDTLAAQNYQVKITGSDGFNQSLNSSLIARNNNCIVVDRLNGVPLDETGWPLRLVGPSIPSYLSVRMITTIDLIGLTPEKPTVTPTSPTLTPTPTVPPTIGDYPVPDFTLTTPSPMEIMIIDNTTNATSIRYDLGDGTSTAYRNFRYYYWAPGTYTITLTATNAVGTSVKTVSITVPATTPTVTATTTVPTPTPSVTPTEPVTGASFSGIPQATSYGEAIKFTVTPAAGKTIRSTWWTFDRVNHYGTWNSRDINPTFFYPAKGTYTPLVKITYTDGSTDTVELANYITVQ